MSNLNASPIAAQLIAGLLILVGLIALVYAGAVDATEDRISRECRALGKAIIDQDIVVCEFERTMVQVYQEAK